MYRNGTSTTIPNRGIEPQRQDQIDVINEEPKELIFTFDPNVHIIESVTIDRDGPLEITGKRDAREKIDCGVIVDISSEGDSLALRCGFCRNDMILAASNIDAAPTICSGTMGCSYVVLTEVLSSERSHALLQSKKRPITFIMRRNINSSQTASAPTRALPTVPEKTDWQHLVDQQFRYANISDSDDSDDERDDPSLSRGVGRFDRSRYEERLEEGDDEEDDDDDDEDEDDDDDFVVDEDAQDDEEEETVPSIGGGSESSQATPSLSPHEVDVNELWGGKLKLGPFIVMSARSGHLTTKVKGK